MAQAQGDYLLTSEVSRILGVSAQTVRVWERRGVLRAVKTAGSIHLFDRADVARLVAERDAERDSRHESSTVAHV